MFFDTLSVMEALAIVCCAPLDTPLLSDEETDATAELFRALGDPARVRIMNVLATNDGPVCVCNLIEPLGLSQPTVSHHLKVLTDAGLITRDKRGVWAYFALVPGALEQVTSHLGTHLTRGVA